MEFKLLNPKTENDFLTEISFNFDDLKTAITQSLEKYQGLTYTEDDIKNAKADRANLNKFKEVLETERKKVKNLCLKPYEDFEKKIKELVGLVNEPISAIDTQVKSFDQKKKEEKYDQIATFYELNIGDLKDLIPLSKILNPKWGNAGESLKSIQEELSEKIAKINCDLQAISIMKSEFELNIKDKYLQTLDLSTALQEKTRLEEQKKLLEQRESEKKQASIGNIQPPAVTPEPKVIEVNGNTDFSEANEGDTVRFMQEPERMTEIEPINQELTDIEQIKDRIIQLHKEKGTRAGVVTEIIALEKQYGLAPVRQIDFRVWMNDEQTQALRQFLIDNGIRYGGVN